MNDASSRKGVIFAEKAMGKSGLSRMEMAWAWLVIISHRAGNLLVPEQAINIPLP